MTQHDDRYALGAYPWERLDAETSKSYAAFIVYRDLGATRTLRRAAMRYYEIPEGEFDPKGGGIRQFEKWSSRNRWVSRAEAWDDWSQTLTDQETAKTILDMKARHASMAVATQAKIVSAIQAMDLTKLPPLQVIQMFDLVVKNERLARGVPATVEAIVASDEGPQLRGVADSDLEAKLAAWRMARDPENTIELGEPGAAAEAEPED